MLRHRAYGPIFYENVVTFLMRKSVESYKTIGMHQISVDVKTSMLRKWHYLWVTVGGGSHDDCGAFATVVATDLTRYRLVTWDTCHCICLRHCHSSRSLHWSFLHFDERHHLIRRKKMMILNYSIVRRAIKLLEKKPLKSKLSAGKNIPRHLLPAR